MGLFHSSPSQFLFASFPVVGVQKESGAEAEVQWCPPDRKRKGGLSGPLSQAGCQLLLERLARQELSRSMTFEGRTPACVLAMDQSL